MPNPPAPPKPTPRKSTETLKVAYTRADDQKTFADVVVFGTDQDRSEFLRANPDTWWRITDLPKGQPLLTALTGARP